MQPAVVFASGDLTCLVLDAAPGILELAFAPVALTFALQLLVAEEAASAFLQVAADLLHAAFDAVGIDSLIVVAMVHISLLIIVDMQGYGRTPPLVLQHL